MPNQDILIATNTLPMVQKNTVTNVEQDIFTNSFSKQMAELITNSQKDDVTV